MTSSVRGHLMHRSHHGCHDLAAYLRVYHEERAHTGRLTAGRIPTP